MRFSPITIRRIAHQRIQDIRTKLLPQVAHGIALFRYQIDHGRHFHWEQPQRSKMLLIPHLQEVHERTLAASFDMCRAGDLRGPISHSPTKKPATILTTSQRMFDELHGRRCNCTATHQEIAGSIRYANGKTVLRTQYTAAYPRKFTRLVAKVITRKLFRREQPYWDRRTAHMYAKCFGSQDARPIASASRTTADKTRAC